MKKTTKRILAFILALCLSSTLALVAPPHVSAEDSQTQTVEYPFYNPSLEVAEGATVDMISKGAVKQALIDSYPSSIDNLIVERSSTATPKMGNRWVYRDATFDYQGLVFWCQLNDWVAFKIQSPGNGKFNVSLNYYNHGNNTKECSVYILPAETTDIAGALGSDTLINAANLRSGTQNTICNAELGEAQFEADKEYIVVFKSTKDRNNGTSTTTAYMHLVGLTMAGQKEPEVTPPSTTELSFYNAALGVKEGERISLATDEALSALMTSYNNKQTNIVYIGCAQSTNEAPNMANQYAYKGTTVFPYQGLLYWCFVGDWVAYKFRSPGTGEFNISLDYYCNGNNTKELSAYILSSETDIDSISAALDVNSLIGTANLRSGADGETNSSVLGTLACETGKEYIIVLKATKDRNGSASGTTARMHLVGLTLDQGTPEIPDDNIIEPISICEPIVTFSMNTFAASGEVNGHDYYYAPTSGGKLYVYDLDTKKKVDMEDTEIAAPRGATVDSNGTVYIIGDAAHIFKYNPYTGVGENIPIAGGASSNYFNIVADKDDNLYFGTNPDARVYKYNTKTGEFTDYGTPDADAKYISSVAYCNGYIYANSYGDANADDVVTKKLLKINAETKQVEATLDLSEKLGKVTYLFNLSVVGDNTLIGGTGSEHKMIAVDMESFQFIDIGIESGCMVGVTEERNGKVYFVARSTGLCEYDIATRNASVVKGFESANIGPRFTVNSFATIDHPDLPGESIFTNSASGPPVFYNLQTGKTVKWSDLTAFDGTGQYIRSFENGPEGSGLIYIGSFHSGNAVGYHVGEEKVTLKYKTGGQTDSQLLYNGKLYAGTYATASVVEMDIANNYSSKTLFSLKKDFWQARIHTLAAGDNKIFAGTVPDLSKYGGMIAAYDQNSGRTYVIAESDLVLYSEAAEPAKWYNASTNATYTFEKQEDGSNKPFSGTANGLSIQCLVYWNGYLYASTSRCGGSGASIENSPADGAVLLVYDVHDLTQIHKVGEYDIAIDGIVNPDFIAGIAPDPNVDSNHKFWGVVSETLFSFTADPNTGAIAGMKEELSFSKTTYSDGGSRQWFPRPIVFDGNGYMYVGFDSKGGFRKININDPEGDNQRIMSDTPMFYALGEDGNLYYAYVFELRMLPLNATDDDKAAASAVDAMIDAIGTVTLGSKAAITTARTAYDGLSNVQKSFVRKLAKLTAAESALAQQEYTAANQAAAKAVDDLINAIGTVTLESEAAINDARTEYDALSSDQKTLVTNYDKLAAAEGELAKLEAEKDSSDKAAAETVTAKIDAIGTVTLGSEEEIKAARAAYEALTEDQKKLVDIAKLTAAEGKLAELKASADKEASDRAAAEAVIKQIDAIGTVTRESASVVANARAAYEALSTDQKLLVSNLDVLTAAEASLAALESPNTGDTAPIAVMAAILMLSMAAVMLVRVSKRKFI